MSSVFFYSVIYTIQEEENPSGFYVDPQRHKSVFPNKKNRNQVFTLNSYNLLISKRLSAEKQGFEPWEQLPVHRISSAARSTTPASLQFHAFIKAVQICCIFLNQSSIGALFFMPKTIFYQ